MRRERHHTLTRLGIATALGVALAAGLAASDYGVYGELEFAVLSVPTIAGDLGLTAAATLRLDHTVSLDWGELSVRHSLSARGVPAGSGAPAEDLTHRLAQAALSLWPADSLTIRLGRFTVPWGAAHVLQPGDALNPHPLDRDGRGFDGVALTWSPSPGASATAAARIDTAYGPVDDCYRRVTGALQVSGYLAGFDGAAGVVYRADSVLRPSAWLSWGAGPVVVYAEAATELTGVPDPGSAGSEPAGLGAGAPPLSAAVIADPLADGRSWAAVAGAQYSAFPRGHSLVILGEYLFLPDPPAGIGRHLVHQHLSWVFGAGGSLALTSLVDVDNRAGVLVPSATLAVFDSLELSADLAVTVTDERPGRRVELRVAAFALAARLYF